MSDAETIGTAGVSGTATALSAFVHEPSNEAMNDAPRRYETWRAVREDVLRLPQGDQELTNSAFMVRRDRPAPRGLFPIARIACGQCLSPHIANGDVLLVEPLAQDWRPSWGDLCMVRVNYRGEQIYLAKVLAQFGDHWALISNDAPLNVSRLQLPQEGLIGLVVAYLHRGCPTAFDQKTIDVMTDSKDIIETLHTRSQHWRNRELGVRGITESMLTRTISSSFFKFQSVIPPEIS